MIELIDNGLAFTLVLFLIAYGARQHTLLIDKLTPSKESLDLLLENQAKYIKNQEKMITQLEELLKVWGNGNATK